MEEEKCQKCQTPCELVDGGIIPYSIPQKKDMFWYCKICDIKLHAGTVTPSADESWDDLWYGNMDEFNY